VPCTTPQHRPGGGFNCACASWRVLPSMLTLTSSGSVRLAHWRAWHHDVSAELYAWLNREYARLGPIAGVGRGSVSSTR
jgi:hypothetical protein